MQDNVRKLLLNTQLQGFLKQAFPNNFHKMQCPSKPFNIEISAKFMIKLNKLKKSKIKQKSYSKVNFQKILHIDLSFLSVGVGFCWLFTIKSFPK